MKPFYFAAALPLAMVVPMMAAGIGATLALAQQQPDPAQAFAEEWGTVVASDTLTAASHKHTADLAQKLIADYQRQREELKKAKDDLAEAEARLQWTLDHWVPKAP